MGESVRVRIPLFCHLNLLVKVDVAVRPLRPQARYNR